MEYIHTKTIESPKAIIRVYRPVLDEKERARRMKAVHDAAAEVLRWANLGQSRKDENR